MLLLAACLLSIPCANAQQVQSYILESAKVTSSSDPYRLSLSASSRSVTISIPMGRAQALNLRAEYFRSSSIPRIFERAWDIEADWKFRSIPLTVSYTFELPSLSTRVTPVVGAGVSAHFYRETNLQEEENGLSLNPSIASISPFSSPASVDYLGLTMGAEVSFGFRTEVNRQIFILTEARYRYVNCSIESFDVFSPGQLNVLDFNVSLGFSL